MAINTSANGLRNSYAKQKPKNFVSFTFMFPSNRTIPPEQAFRVHCYHFNDPPNFYFDPASDTTPENPDSWMTTLRGHIILEDENVPLPVVMITFELLSVVTLDVYVRHCESCGKTTHSRPQCPLNPCRYCKKTGHWKKNCPQLQKLQKGQAGSANAREMPRNAPIRQHPGPKRKPIQLTR